MTRQRTIAGVILAAGKSERMGQLKQLLPFRGQSILESVIDTALQSSLQSVAVVLGHQADRIEPLLKDKKVTVIRNPDYAKGQSSSLRAGLDRVKEQVDGVLFLLADQPLLRPETIDSLLSAYRQAPHPIVVPTFNGQRGNPVLIDRELFPQLFNLREDNGARVLFEKYRDDILKIAVLDSSILIDIDTEEDYHNLCARENPSF